MRTIITIAFVFTCLSSFSQLLVSKVYNWDNSPVKNTQAGTTRKIFSGSGAILSQHEINGISLLKNKTLTYEVDSTGKELFFVIKKGPVTVHLNGQTSILDRGSVIFILPGDNVSIENAGQTTVEFYEMLYHSIATPDTERGKKAGPSFVMNWNDMVFKPHDKGGVRQLFDRQTKMLNRFDIHVTQLNAGNKSHDPHTHKNEEIILMLDGNAEMQIGESHQKANPGDVVLLNSNVLHNLTNIGTVPCLYFAIQWN